MKCSLLTLSCYVDAELAAPRKGELEAHLVGCHRCRAGLGHLREEVERVEGLARVHLPEGSARLLFEHTGLVAAGDPMPAIPDATAVGELPASTPPWLRGGTGAALPWATGRPASPPRRTPISLPAPGGPIEPAPPDATAAADTFDVWAAARMAPPAPMPAAPPVEPPPLEAAAPAEVEETPPEQVEAVAPEPAEEPEPAPAAPEQPPRQGLLARRRARREAAAAAEATVLEPELEPEPEAALPEPAPEPAPEPEAAVPEPEPPPAAAAPEPEPEPDRDADPVPSLTSSASAPDSPGTAEIAAAAVPPGGEAVPVWTPESSVEAPPVPRYPLTDDDALEAPSTVERFGPMPAPRPSMVDRLRERLALRRALKVAALDEGEDGIEIVSGPGAPVRSHRSRADLARRRSEALRPASRPDGADWDEGEDAVAPERPSRREPTVDELLPPPARPSSFGAAAPPPITPSYEEEIEEEPTAWRPVEPEPPAPSRRRRGGALAGAAEPVAAGEASAAARTVDGRRLTVVLAAAILLMFIVGVASARSTTPLPSTGASQSVQPPAVAGPRNPAVVPQRPPAAVQPPAVVAPAPPKPVTAPPPGLTGMVTLGEGAAGWSVQDIRYGAHTGYLRMVLDFTPAAGAASGTPKVTIGFQDPTTLIITLDQVVAHGAPAAPGPGSVITSISLMNPPPATGSTAYVVKLAHAVQFSPSFASSPLRLILDLH